MWREKTMEVWLEGVEVTNEMKEIGWRGWRKGLTQHYVTGVGCEGGFARHQTCVQQKMLTVGEGQRG